MSNVDQALLELACNGDRGAMDWLARAVAYFHAADDLLDERTTAEFKIRTLVMGHELYVHPFFLKHGVTLHAVMRTCINTYADSVAWEKSEDPAKAAWADHARHCGCDLVTAVADLCGGWDLRRQVSQVLREYNLKVSVDEKKGN